MNCSHLDSLKKLPVFYFFRSFFLPNVKQTSHLLLNKRTKISEKNYSAEIQQKSTKVFKQMKMTYQNCIYLILNLFNVWVLFYFWKFQNNLHWKLSNEWFLKGVESTKKSWFCLSDLYLYGTILRIGIGQMWSKLFSLYCIRVWSDIV